MAFYSGNAASVSINGQTVTGVKSWTFTINKEIPETTALGASAKTYQTTTYGGEGTIECIMDAGGSNYQNLFIANSVADTDLSTVKLELASGDSINMSSALVTGVDFGVGTSELATLTINFIANGAITFTALDT